MVSSTEIAQITLALQELPADKISQVKELVRSLSRDCATALSTESSDVWTPEDELDVARASMIQFDREHPEDEGYDDIPTR